MRKLYFLLTCLLFSCLSSCVDVEESYDFHADGSCNVNYNFDMSKAISVLINLLPDSVKQKPEFGTVKDTTLNFYNVIPDSTHLKMDSGQVAMTKNSDVVIYMDLKNNLMNVSLRHSADNNTALVYYLNNLTKMTSDEQLGAIIKNNKSLRDLKGSRLMIGQDCYVYEVGPHTFNRKVDHEKFGNYIKKNESVFKMSKAMLIDMPYKIVIRLAKPITGVENSKAVLSADKKSVTIETTMDEAIKNPDVMSFKIDF